ncbi:hypothetical protein EDB83DRAFT_1957956 [Lactarius deliciosus]|nr:hypothetical protein EDB83DRAFT_1957956 [Lactarius deliciosus]
MLLLSVAVLGYSSLRGSAPPSLLTHLRTIWMPVAKNVSPASSRESKKESPDPVEPESSRRETRTAYIGHSKPRSSGRQPRPSILSSCVIKPRPTIRTNNPRRPLGQAPRQDR